MASANDTSDLVIRGCDVIRVSPGGGHSVVPAQDIHVVGGTIASIVPTEAGASRADRSAASVDARGLLAVPGLTNAHTHSPMTLMRGAAEDVTVEDWFNARVWPMEMNLTPERVEIGARLACAEMLLAGVTAFADHYFHAPAIARAAVDTGIRADIAPTFFSSQGDEGRELAFDAAREIAQLGIGRIRASLGPHAPYTVHEEDLVRTAQVARDDRLRIHIHASENLPQVRSSVDRTGVTPIEVLARTGVLDAGVLIAHGCGITDADIEILARHAGSTAVACCPKVYLKHALTPTTPVRALLNAGIAVGAGTDGAAGHNTLDVWESMRLVALVQKQESGDPTWMRVSEAFDLATAGGARAMGLGGTTGALEPGRAADIVLVDLSAPHCQPLHDPVAALVYSVRASDVRTVIVDGVVVVRDGVLTTMDVGDLLAEVRAIAPELVRVRSGEAVQHYAP